MTPITIDIHESNYQYFHAEAEHANLPVVEEHAVVTSPELNQDYDMFLNQFMSDPLVDDQTLHSLFQENTPVQTYDTLDLLNNSSPFIDFSVSDSSSSDLAFVFQ